MEPDIIKNIKWLGHDGFAIKSGRKLVVIDPYKIDECEPADLILITHPHFDHLSLEDIQKIVKPSTIFVTDEESAKSLTGDIRIVKPGDKLKVAGFVIEVVPAYNTNKEFHPSKNNWLGFIINVGGTRIYHAGDTDLIPEMETFSADIALLPVSGTFVMTAKDAAEAAKRIKSKIAVPMHYGSVIGTEEDAVKFKDALKGECKVTIFTK